MKSRFPQNPEKSITVIVHRETGHTFQKGIKGSARTSSIVTQHWARMPQYFVFRVNCYPRSRT